MQTIKLDIKVKKVAVAIKTGSTKKVSIDIRYKVFGKWDKGEPGQQILLMSDGTNIKRKYTSDVTRNNLVDIDDLKGDQWDQGIQGIQGIKWDAGEDGREVELANDGTNIQWRYVGWSRSILTPLSSLKWDKGDKWDTGDTWPQGIKGDKWDPGDTGPQWVQGIKGDKWDQGIQWVQGIQWEPGPQGPQGPEGDAFIYSIIFG